MNSLPTVIQNVHAVYQLLDAMPIPIFVWRRSDVKPEELTLLFANQRCGLDWKVEFQECIGKSFKMLKQHFKEERDQQTLEQRLFAGLGNQGVAKTGVIVFDIPEATIRTYSTRIVSFSPNLVIMICAYPFKALLKASHDVVGIIDKDGNPLYRTPSSYLNFGFKQGESAGQDVDALFDQPSLEAIDRVLQEVTEKPNDTVRAQLRRQQKDGTWRYVEIMANNQLDNPEVEGIIVNSRDVTDRVLAQQRVEELNRDLESFNYTVSHDLKTPLRILSSYIDQTSSQVRDTRSDAENRNADLMLDTVNQMSHLIEDLLDFSRLGQSPITKKSVELSDLLQDLANELRQIPAHSKATITIQPDMICFADPALIRQAFANLLGNSLKFVRANIPSEIEVDMTLTGDMQVIHVRDNGVGFDLAKSDDPFTVFKRLHKSSEVEGSGIGLATVKRIIEKHGGQVWAESEIDKGSTFHIRLPREIG